MTRRILSLREISRILKRITGELLSGKYLFVPL